MTPDWTTPRRKTAIITALVSRDGDFCSHCGMGGEDLDVVQKQLGDGHTLRNLRLLCGPCRESNGAARPEKTVRFASGVMQAGFTMVPNLLLLDGTFSPLAVRLYGLLAHYAWRDEREFPGQPLLIAQSGSSERSVRNALRELESRGLLETKRRGLGKTNVYVLKDPKADEFAVSPEDPGSSGRQPNPDRQYLPISPDRQDLPIGPAGSAAQDRQSAPILKDNQEAVKDQTPKDPPNPRKRGSGSSASSPSARAERARSGSERKRDKDALSAELEGRAAHPAAVDVVHAEARWMKVDEHLRAATQASESTYAQWLAPLHLHRVDDGEWLVGCPPEVYAWVQQRFLRLLLAAVQAVDGQGASVTLVPCRHGP